MKFLIVVIVFCVLIDTGVVIHNLAKAESKLTHIDEIMAHMDTLMKRLVVAVENRNDKCAR